MKKWLIIGGILAVGGAAAHYGIWTQQVRINHNALEQMVSAVNTQLNMQAMTLSYDEKEMEKTYPFNAGVIYHNPTITFQPAFYEHPLIEKALVDAQHTLPLVDNIQIQGSYAIYSKQLGNAYSTIINGHTVAQGKYEDTGAFHYAIRSEDEMQCNIELSRSPLGYLVKKDIPYNIDTVIQAINMLECYTDSVIVEDVKTQKTISQWDDYRASFTIESGKKVDYGNVAFDVHVDGLKYIRTQDDMIREYEQQFAPLSDAQRSVIRLLKKHPVPALSNAQSGAQDIHLVGSYDGALSEAALQHKEASFQLDVNTLDVSNALYRSSTPFYLRFDDNKIALQYDGTMAYQPEFEAMLQDSVTSVLNIIHSPELQVEDQLKTALKNITEDQLSALVPVLSSFDEITMKADVTLPKKQGNIILKKLSFNAAPYRLNISGEGNISPTEANIVILCDSCESLLNNVFTYAGNMQLVMQAFYPNVMEASGQSISLTPELSQALTQFILELDTTKDEDYTTITLQSEADGGISISGMPLMAVMIQGFAVLSPYLNAP